MKTFLGKLVATIQALALLTIPVLIFFNLVGITIFNPISRWYHPIIIVGGILAYDFMLGCALFLVGSLLSLIGWWIQWMILPPSKSWPLFGIQEAIKRKLIDIFFFLPNSIAKTRLDLTTLT
jgi:hypothetical protein